MPHDSHIKGVAEPATGGDHRLPSCTAIAHLNEFSSAIQFCHLCNSIHSLGHMGLPLQVRNTIGIGGLNTGDQNQV